MASASDSNQHGGHPLTRSLAPRPTAPPTSHTRQSAQTQSSLANSDPVTHPAEDDPIGSAMNASSRTGRSLSELLAALGEFQASVSGARDTHEHLQIELEQIRDLLGRTNTERLALKNRVAALEAELAERGDITELDASYVQEEQDRFIAALIDEYDDELATLRAERDQARAQLGLGSTMANPSKTIPSPAPNDDLEQARQRIDQLVADREKTRTLIKRAQTQRDAAQAKADRLEKELAHLKTHLDRARGDKHTRPTDPPPDSEKPLRSSEAITERPPSEDKVSRAPQTKKAARDRKGSSRRPARELSLSEIEDEWDRTTTPAPPPSYESALDEKTRAPGSLRQPSPPAELRAALTSPGSPKSGETPVSSLPRVIAAATKPAGNKPAQQLFRSPTLPKVTPSLAEATKEPSAAGVQEAASQPPSTMGYPADKKPPLKRKPDPMQRPLVGYSKSSEDVAEEHIHARPLGPTRTRH